MSRIPVSYAQERLWFLQQLAPGDPAYNEPLCLRIHGPVDPASLDRALARLIRRHDVLRTTFEADRAGVRQVTHADGQLDPVVVRDVPGVEPTRRDAVAQAECARLALAPFNLAVLPLLRTVLMRFAEDDHALLIVGHHLLMDGWSEETLLAELGELYATDGAHLPELSVRPGEVAVAERSAAPDPEAESFWLDHIGDAPLGVVVPLVEQPAGVQEAGLARRQFPLEAGTSLVWLARSLGTSPFCVLRTVYELTLAELTGADDFLVGCPFSIRLHRVPEHVVGFFINLLPIRSSAPGTPDFRRAVQQVSLTIAHALSYGDYPYAHIVRALRRTRECPGSPVQQAFAYDVARPVGSFGTAPARRLPMPPPRPRFDFVMTVTQIGDSWTAALDSATGRVAPGFVEDFANAFTAKLRTCVAQATATA